MERWSGKVAVVTGASVGIGEAIAKSLAKNGMVVVALSRNEDKINRLAMLSKGKIHAMKCDVRYEKSVVDTFRAIEKKFGGVDVLVNNAGYLNGSPLSDGSSAVWKDTLDTNVMGTSLCSKEALKSMRKRGDDGHIININSIAGHAIRPNLQSSLGMYPPSKFAVTGLTQMLRQELRMVNSNVKVTSISPGLVHTDMGNNAASLAFNKGKEEDFDQTPSGFLSAQDIADSIVATLSFGPNVEIQELTVQSSSLPKL